MAPGIAGRLRPALRLLPDRRSDARLRRVVRLGRRHGLRSRSIPAGRSMAGRTRMRERRAQWLSRCGIALFNEVETTTLAGVADPAEAARKLRRICRRVRLSSSNAARTARSPSGRGNACFCGGSQSCKVVDTIGAGDVFNAAFLAALARGQAARVMPEGGVPRLPRRAISTLPRSYRRPRHHRTGGLR